MQATIHGCMIQYTISRHADASAPRILLLHGWGCDSGSFSFIEGALLSQATVITLDFPGHGRSDEPPEPWGVGEYMEQLYALLQQESLLPVQVVAHSFGCRVAIKMAHAHPQAIGRLVITGGAGIRPPVSEHSRKRTARFKACNGFLQKLTAIKPLTPLVARLQTALRNHFGSQDYIKLDETMRKCFVKIVNEDLLPLLGSIQSPTLLIWGSADTATPLWMGQTMETEIPDAGLVVFEGGSHFAFMEQWQRFVLIVKRFLLEENPE